MENNKEASMSRARADHLDEIALALARYLNRECGADPNPSGDSADDTPPLIADVEYTVPEAMKITGFAEVTLQKMRCSGRLPYRKNGGRVLMLGKHLAQIMAKQLTQSTTSDPDPES